MTDTQDIVWRLLNSVVPPTGEAADEIKRLRAENARLREALHGAVGARQSPHDNDYLEDDD